MKVEKEEDAGEEEVKKDRFDSVLYTKLIYD